ncbi:MAG: CotH kinase family protein [Prevotella sp.]|nr:CotH kinase family protein [Prevotella sp.]
MKKKNYTHMLLFMVLMLMPTHLMADAYDKQNYPPVVDTVVLERTNLPIVFIDTRCGGDDTKAIHYDYRIAVRMKIINNPDGRNYGDTVAHPSQTVDYDGWVAIRYRGNTSFTFSAKKPYNFKTMKTADPEGEKQKTALLGMPKDNTWVLLAPYGDRSLLRDVLVWQLARPYFDYTPRCRYCEVVLDGLYYGIYILAENIRKGSNRLNLDDPGLSGDALTGGYQLQIDRNDEPYFASAYPAIDSNGNPYKEYSTVYLQYKHPDYEDLLPGQAEYIQQRLRQMEDALASDDFTNPDTGYQQYLDPISFIDQQLSQEFSGNIDGYRLSTNIYKHRDSQDGRFKTALWDFDLAFANTNSANAQGTDFWRYQNSYLTKYNAYNKVPFWWMRLMEDPAYVRQLKERWAQYRLGNYSNDHIEATIDSITALLSQDGALERNKTAWQILQVRNYETVINDLKKWIEKRVEWMDEQLDFDNSFITNVNNAVQNKSMTACHTIDGKRIDCPGSRGLPSRITLRNALIIVRYSDGTTAKFITTK